MVARAQVRTVLMVGPYSAWHVLSVGSGSACWSGTGGGGASVVVAAYGRRFVLVSQRPRPERRPCGRFPRERIDQSVARVPLTHRHRARRRDGRTGREVIASLWARSAEIGLRPRSSTPAFT